MKEPFKILNNNLLALYEDAVPLLGGAPFESLEDSELSIENFSFYTSVSAVYSSKIEGEEIELDAYLKHKKSGISFKKNYTKKIDDLYAAYSFAKNNMLNIDNVHKSHALITRNILAASNQGKLRKGNMYVLTDFGKIEYVAAAANIISVEIEKLFVDIALLLNTNLSFLETFFYAAQIHLVFVKIHPYEDGNGRTARLLEKWFLSEKLGSKAWFLLSEKNYYLHHNLYYQNLRKLGMEYDFLDYEQSLPFLLMLANSLNLHNQ